MEVVVQTLEEILDSLQPIEVDWKDETARNVIERLKEFPVKDHYTSDDIVGLLSQDFKEGKLIFRLFLGLSKDRFEGLLANALGRVEPGLSATKQTQKNFWQRSTISACHRPWLRKLITCCIGQILLLSGFVAVAGVPSRDSAAGVALRILPSP